MAGNIALQGVVPGEGRRRRQAEVQGNQAFEQKQSLGEQQSEINQQKIEAQGLANASTKEKSRITSTVLGAAQLEGFLKNKDIEGAKSFLLKRRENLNNRAALGEDIDTVDTEDALNQLVNGDIEGLSQQLNSITSFGMRQGILKDLNSSKAGFTLSPGQERFDPSGKLLAQVSPKSDILSPEALEQKKEIRAAGKGQTNVSVGVGETSFQKEIGKASADDLVEGLNSSRQAVKTIESAKRARGILDQGIISGSGANFITGLGKGLLQAGLIEEGSSTEETLANTEAFVGDRVTEVGAIIKLFGAGTGLSDADREFATKAAAGDITMTEKSLRKLIKIGDNAARKIIKRHNKTVGQLKPELLKSLPFEFAIEEPEEIEDVSEISTEELRRIASGK